MKKRVLVRINPNQMVWSGRLEVDHFIDFLNDTPYLYYKKKGRFIPVLSMTLREYHNRCGRRLGDVNVFAKAMKGSLIWCSYCNEYKRAFKFKKLHPVAKCKECCGSDNE